MSPSSSTASGKPGKAAIKTATNNKEPLAKVRPTRPAAAKSTSKASKTHSIPPEERMRLVAEAAYYKAEKRDFAQGSDLEDWIEAEAEIDALLNSH